MKSMKKFIITNTQTSVSRPSTEYSISGMSGGSIRMPERQTMSLDITIEVYGDFVQKDFNELEDRLNQPLPLPGAPSYEELIQRYHPEYLL